MTIQTNVNYAKTDCIKAVKHLCEDERSKAEKLLIKAQQNAKAALLVIPKNDTEYKTALADLNIMITKIDEAGACLLDKGCPNDTAINAANWAATYATLALEALPQ